jgi:hypothetical protein
MSFPDGPEISFTGIGLTFTYDSQLLRGTSYAIEQTAAKTDCEHDGCYGGSWLSGQSLLLAVQGRNQPDDIQDG